MGTSESKFLLATLLFYMLRHGEKFSFSTLSTGDYVCTSLQIRAKKNPPPKIEIDFAGTSNLTQEAYRIRVAQFPLHISTYLFF
jgi:hypothetical protein